MSVEPVPTASVHCRGRISQQGGDSVDGNIYMFADVAERIMGPRFQDSHTDSHTLEYVGKVYNFDLLAARVRSISIGYGKLKNICMKFAFGYLIQELSKNNSLLY